MKKPGCWMLLCGTALIMGCALPLGEDFEIGGGGYARTAASFAGGGDNSVISILEKNKEATSTVEISMSLGLEELTEGINLVYAKGGGDPANAVDSPRKVLIDGGGSTLRAATGNVDPLITVGGGVELTLQNITLHGVIGQSGETVPRKAPLVKVEAGGKLILDSGAVLKGNTNSANFSAGGVEVAGTLVMTGTAEISGNTAMVNSGGGNHSGGGVYVAPGGDFTLIRGTIAENKAIVLGHGMYSAAGVYVASGGKFTMEGGSITENKFDATVQPSWNYFGATGVFAAGEFAMKGGEITKNIGGGFSGGVWVERGSSPNDGFTMSGGTITDNESKLSSGGVWIEKGTFIMKGGTIFDNTTSSSSFRNIDKSSGGLGHFYLECATLSGGEGTDYCDPD
ncbi:MAG: hypothetical protein LBU19_11490 [Treponema sp.]|jgi:hypothetical protein|nr:hypothetical protein [Treponema sp.]